MTQPPLKWLYLDLNSFFASVEQQLRPEMRGRPVAVVPALTDATCAIAASYEAKAFGVKTGTKIYEAKRMCPELVCIPANHEHYVYFHHRIMAVIDRHIPIYKAESVDEFSCQLDQSEACETAARALGLAIKASLREVIGPYVRCSIGLGPNRFLAKTASNLEKPDGLQILHAHDMPQRMYGRDVSELVGVGKGMQQRLLRSGVTTIEQLYALPAKRMRAIWGSVGGERYYHLLRGVELPEIPTKKSTIGHSHVLEPQWRSTDQAQEVMRRLLLKAASRLRRMDYYASAMSINLRVENGPKLRHSRRFHRACDNRSLQAEMLALWAELVQLYRPQRLKKISVTLHELTAGDDLQPGLFDTLHPSAIQQSKKDEQLSRAMDALNSRFGRDTVTMGSLPRRVRCFSGTKIAFTRIPQLEEFQE